MGFNSGFKGLNTVKAAVLAVHPSCGYLYTTRPMCADPARYIWAGQSPLPFCSGCNPPRVFVFKV